MDNFPSTKTMAAKLLYSAANHMKSCPNDSTTRGYNDRKAGQILDAIGDLLIAEVQVESWFADMQSPRCGGCLGD